MRAARYLGARPWELAEQPTYWRDLALMAEGAEGVAQRMAAAEAKRQRKIDEFVQRPPAPRRGK